MEKRVREFIGKEINLKHIPGAVIHISHQGKVLYEEALGYRSVFPTKEKMALNTVFDLASLTKVVATLPSILKLIEYGDIHLDDRIKTILPKFATNGKEDITIKHLLTHTSGLPAHRRYYEEKLGTEQIINQIYQESLVSAIGEQVIYSDLGFITLYQVIEAVTGKRFEDFVQKEVFEPLEMKETGFNPSFNEKRFAATEYSEGLQGYKQGIVHDDNTEFMGGISGHAGLFSTMSDLTHFAEMIENDGVYKGKTILSARSLQISRKNYSPFDTEFRGLGWILKSPIVSSCGDLFSVESYGHTGFTGTSIWFDPKVDLRVILLTNRVHYGRKDPILRLRPRFHNIIRSYFD
ncbi:penicillin-binding protein [Alkalihalobacillus alcalophilus ATCC 27647 = CGMCC 1.3604]|uniref:Penicillin-binding protein n=1 Tax=Alkalihalobacillus alcalophilus ATCC 27647 = CGMCC 1.3604 TaxID=1218173 RepID=A0A094XJP5_ALKAL|nr:serine hydrolase domain-containing protein [Alkalihalobacillus alcalophilus]KGA99000.1 penicillin-binding protein [Alkalihalobacillus alcalophilus ATCC 27647 = CGMCC 1.3604]MED1560636.1 serine hydrolase [Alkalihalobacillus alcalophilus]THG88359.1 penicillin-binding protein [Alkalihalobacillus alcalophilus ATCC 27647 = CGMCC 1.3604]